VDRHRRAELSLYRLQGSTRLTTPLQGVPDRHSAAPVLPRVRRARCPAADPSRGRRRPNVARPEALCAAAKSLALNT